MIPAAITREFAHQARRRAASRLPSIPGCVGPTLERAETPAVALSEISPAPLRAPLAEIARLAA